MPRFCSPRPRPATILPRVLLPVSVLTLLGGCAPGLLDPAGPVAAGERTILLNSLGIMLAIVVPTMVLTIAFAWWFRAGNTKATYLPDFSYSGRLELLVWSIPALVIVFLGGIAWIGSHDLDPPKSIASHQKALEVDVVALDWKWLFLYPEQGVASVNRLVLPAGRPVHFRLTSGTVMNSFFIPRLGSQIYAMSGMTTNLNLQADTPGRYMGISAHYSGRGFPDMTFNTDAVRPAQFDGWVQQAKASARPLDARAYDMLSQEDIVTKPYTYSAIVPGMFERVVRLSGTTSHKLAIDGRER